MSPSRAPSKFWLLGLLVLPLGATAMLSWKLQRDATTLRANATELAAENAQLRASLAALDERQQALQRQLAQTQSEPAGRATMPPPASPAPPPAAAQLRPAHGSGHAAQATGLDLTGRVPAPAGPHGNIFFPELLSDPHYAQLFLTTTRQNQAVRYALLFATLAKELAPEDLLRFKEFLAARDMAVEEVDGILELAAMAGKRNVERETASRIKAQVRRTLDQELAQTFAPEVVATLRAFENDNGARQQFLDKLALRLSYSAAPLEKTQAGRLAELYRRTSRQSSLSSGAPGSALADAFMSQAENILTPGQMAALQEIRAELDAGRTSSIRIRNTSSSRPSPVPFATAP